MVLVFYATIPLFMFIILLVVAGTVFYLASSKPIGLFTTKVSTTETRETFGSVETCRKEVAELRQFQVRVPCLRKPTAVIVSVTTTMIGCAQGGNSGIGLPVGSRMKLMLVELPGETTTLADLG